MRIVLSRTDRVGDLILSTPAIASFRRSFPDAHITAICSSYNASVLRGNPDIDDLADIAPGVAPAEFGKRFRQVCDLAVALAPRMDDIKLVAATKAKQRIGYTYARRLLVRAVAPLYLTKVGISSADPGVSERDPRALVAHEVDQVLELVRLAGGDIIAADLVLPISAADRAAVAHLPANGIAFHLAPRWISDGSTLANMLTLIGQLRMLGLPIVATYGPESLAIAQAVREARLAGVTLAGDLSLQQWAATFEKSAVVVTVDTGATHVASAVRRPTVVVFEHRYFRLSSQEWAPYRVPHVILRKPSRLDEPALAESRSDVIAAVSRLLNDAQSLSRHTDL